MLLGETKTAVQQWEHKQQFVEIPLHPAMFKEKHDALKLKKERLCKHGEDGWELVAVTGYYTGEAGTKKHHYIETLYFKKPLE